MNWIAMRHTLSLLLLLTAVHAFATPAKARQAKCLFEIDGAHYIGSPCEFTPIDKKGSFRIANTSGSGIEAEVKVTAPHEGIASWTGPHKTPRDWPLGKLRQAAGCWSDRTTYVCAWSLDQDIYLGPRDKKLFVAYGERDGMDDEIESAVGLDTSHAVIHTKPSRRAALYYTIGQTMGESYSQTAAEEAYQERAQSRNRTITADCQAKEWTGLNGLRYRLLGRIETVDRSQFVDSGDVAYAKWAVLDVKNNRLVDDCGACSYAEIHDWFKKLCPSIAPRDW
ncbi:hypothetical protein [Bradyrhizobium sp. CB2312]|uniref:hypothetical protein n=1 Tax=Bradyrhizobium sp. CB2312 TaxID=3039155 RepID=UPI0024B0CA81|nr:hypothetical protein [Bradyrhizobium sp. CB2312]WFU70595.1 hypothetical protein QA642_35825 [Bradyrhizobium sp. CB2312]